MRILLIVLALIMPITAQAAEDVSAKSKLTISSLNKQHPTTGTFTIEGYVVQIYQCPPCPEDAMCKPCMKGNITVSENNQLLDSYSTMTDKEIIVFTREAKKLELGKKYSISVKLLPSKSTGASANDTELLSYTPLN